MPEQELVQKMAMPVTVQSLKQDLCELGVEPGMVLLVHSSLNSIGWVSGGPISVILALQEALGRTGTLVMPSHSGDLSDPSTWEKNPPPSEEWDEVRRTMPAYHPDRTPTCYMGAIPECFRKQPGVIRSHHPQTSFCAWGAHAEQIVNNHLLDFGLGEHSPLRRIYDLEGMVLLLGVGHASNTSMHLAEYRASYDSKKIVQQASPILVGGQKRWVTFPEINLNSDDFDKMGEDFLSTVGKDLIRHGWVGDAKCQLIPQRALVDFAVEWLPKNRV